MENFEAKEFVNAVHNIYAVCRYAQRDTMCKFIVLTAINCCDYDYKEAYAFLKDVLQAQNPNWEKIPEAYGYKRICRDLLNFAGNTFTQELKSQLVGKGLVVSKTTKTGKETETLSDKGDEKDYKKCFYNALDALKLNKDLALLDICLDQQGWKRIVTHIIKIALGVLPCPVSVPSAVSGYAKELAEMPVPEVGTKHKKATAAKATPKVEEVVATPETQEVAATSTHQVEEVVATPETKEVAAASTPITDEIAVEAETKEVAAARTPKVEEVAVETETQEVAATTKDVAKKKKGRAGTQIEQWSSDGKKLMRIFKSQLAASIETGINRSSIVKCLGSNPTYATAGGYIWKLHTPEAEAAESAAEAAA